MEFFIVGLRKITQQEISELTGKSAYEMGNSVFWRSLFPDAPYYYSGYQVYSEKTAQEDELASIRHILTPVEDDQGNTLYVCWSEELNRFWMKDPDEREKVKYLLEEVEDMLNEKDSFHVIPAAYVMQYCDRRPVIRDEEKEIITVFYG